MKNVVSLAALAASLLSAVAASAGERPSFEMAGLPITPHQVAVMGTAQVQEQTSTQTLTLGGMPASPHQAAVLTPRPRAIQASAAAPERDGVSLR